MSNKNKTWDKTKRCFIDTPDKMSSFFDDIEELCEKYNFSIAHEDCHGGFLIEEYSQNNMEWLRDASKNYEEETCKQCDKFIEFFTYNHSILQAAGCCQMAGRDMVATDPYNEMPSWCPKKEETKND